MPPELTEYESKKISEDGKNLGLRASYNAEQIIEKQIGISSSTIKDLDDTLIPDAKAQLEAMRKFCGAVDAKIIGRCNEVNDLVDDIIDVHKERLATESDLDSYNQSMPAGVYDQATGVVYISGEYPQTIATASYYEDNWNPYTSTEGLNYLQNINKSKWPSNIQLVKTPRLENGQVVFREKEIQSDGGRNFLTVKTIVYDYNWEIVEPCEVDLSDVLTDNSRTEDSWRQDIDGNIDDYSDENKAGVTYDFSDAKLYSGKKRLCPSGDNIPDAVLTLVGLTEEDYNDEGEKIDRPLGPIAEFGTKAGGGQTIIYKVDQRVTGFDYNPKLDTPLTDSQIILSTKATAIEGSGATAEYFKIPHKYDVGEGTNFNNENYTINVIKVDEREFIDGQQNKNWGKPFLTESGEFIRENRTFSGEFDRSSNSDYNNFMRARENHISKRSDSLENRLIPDSSGLKDQAHKLELNLWALNYSRLESSNDINTSINGKKLLKRYKEELRIQFDGANDVNNEELPEPKKFKDLSDDEKKSLSLKLGLGIPKITFITDETGDPILRPDIDPKDPNLTDAEKYVTSTDSGFNEDFDNDKIREFLTSFPSFDVTKDYFITTKGSLVIVDSVGVANTYVGLSSVTKLITSGGISTSNAVGVVTISNSAIHPEFLRSQVIENQNRTLTPPKLAGVVTSYNGFIGTEGRSWMSVYSKRFHGTLVGSALSIFTNPERVINATGEHPIVMGFGSSETTRSSSTPMISTDFTYNVETLTLNVPNISIGGTVTYNDVTNIDSLGIITARSDLNVSGNVSVGGGLTVTGALNVCGDTTLSSALDVSGNTTIKGTLNVSGNTTLSSKLTVSGSTCLKGHLSISGITTIRSGSTLKLQTDIGNIRGYIQATETNDSHLIIATSGGEDIAFKDGGTGGSTNMVIRGDGNVAITGNVSAATAAFTTSATIGGNRVLTVADEGSGNGIDADTLDGQEGSYYLNATNLNDGTISDARLPSSMSAKTFTGNVTIDNDADLRIGDGAANERILIQKADNNVSDHIIFYNGTTRIGEIGCEDTSWLRINQETATNIYTPRYIRSDGGFFVDGTTKGINGSGNFIGGTIAGASDYGSLLRSDANDTATGTLTLRDVVIQAGYTLQRSDHHTGHLEGSYNNVGANSYKSNPIYSIGSDYNPNDASLSNFYGIGYSHTNATFISPTTSAGTGWGMYVAADGDARVWLNGTNGTIWSSGNHYINNNRVLTVADEGSGNGLDADTLDGQHGSYYSNYDNLSNKPTIPTNNNQLTNGAQYATTTALNTAVANSANWDTAYGWGDHASAGYITSADGGNASLLEGYSTCTSNTVNTIVRRDSNGDFSGRWISASFLQMSTDDNNDLSNNEITKIMVERNNTGWIYHGTALGVRNFLFSSDPTISASISLTGGTVSTGSIGVSANVHATVYYDRSNTGYFVRPNATTSTNYSMVADGLIQGSAFVCRAGYNGNYSNAFNIQWTGTSAKLWIDSTNVGTFTFSSDYRLKRNVKSMKSGALDRIKLLKPIEFQWDDYEKVNEEGLVTKLSVKSDEIHEGFLAHELQEIVPSAVSGEKDSPEKIQSLRLGGLEAVTVKALQELADTVDLLKEDINNLTQKVIKLEELNL